MVYHVLTQTGTQILCCQAACWTTAEDVGLKDNAIYTGGQGEMHAPLSPPAGREALAQGRVLISSLECWRPVFFSVGGSLGVAHQAYLGTAQLVVPQCISAQSLGISACVRVVLWAVSGPEMGGIGRYTAPPPPASWLANSSPAYAPLGRHMDTFFALDGLHVALVAWFLPGSCWWHSTLAFNYIP